MCYDLSSVTLVGQLIFLCRFDNVILSCCEWEGPEPCIHHKWLLVKCFLGTETDSKKNQNMVNVIVKMMEIVIAEPYIIHVILNSQWVHV